MDATQVIIAVAQKNTRLHVPPDADPVLKKIIKSVWEENPSKRYNLFFLFFLFLFFVFVFVFVFVFFSLFFLFLDKILFPIE